MVDGINYPRKTAAEESAQGCGLQRGAEEECVEGAVDRDVEGEGLAATDALGEGSNRDVERGEV